MRYFAISLLSFIFALAQAAPVVNSHTIKWKTCDRWENNGVVQKIVAFENARYLSGDLLPHFFVSIPLEDDNQSYKVEIKNAVYIPLTSEETEVLSGATFQSEASLDSYAVTRDGYRVLDVHILPFVAKEQSVLKLISFDLSIEKDETIHRAASSITHTYEESSVLSQGKFVKIRIENSGIYKLTYDDLKGMGFSSPENIRIFGYGGAELSRDFTQPKIDDLPEVAIWDSGSYVLFYAQGINKWSYDTSQKKFKHLLNTYSQYGYYFITSGTGVGKRITEGAAVNPGGSTVYNVSEFTDYQVHEKEQRVIIHSGRDFFGEIFDATLAYDFSFNFPNLVLSDNSVQVRLSAAAASKVSSYFTLKLNNTTQQNTMTITQLSNEYSKGNTKEEYFTYTPTGNLSFNLKYNKTSGTGTGYLNYLEVNARRQLIMSGDAMPFRNIDNLGTNTYNLYSLSGASDNIQIWDISDQQNIQRVAVNKTGQTQTFYSSNTSLKEYIAINPTATYPKPTVVGEIANQNLHGLPQVDMLIITHPRFLDEANNLANAHREYDKMLVEVVTTEQVYNEFSSGTPDASAYRWIMKMFYDRAASLGTYPQSLLLFGKGSYDNRGLFDATKNTNLILTVQGENLTHQIDSYVTDDFYAYMKNESETNLKNKEMAFGVGRFTTITKQEAEDVVNKNIAYLKNTNKGAWKNQICFVGDDGDKYKHMDQADVLARRISDANKNYQINKIYLDAYTQQKTASGDKYPLAKDRLQNLFRSGMFYLNFVGHAGPNGWTGEQILTASDISKLSNQYWPLCFAATCSFILFDDGDVSSGEKMLLNPVGGSIGVVSASRVVYSDNNFSLNKEFNKYIIEKENGNYLSIGEMLRRAKNSLKSDSNKLSYILIGNPALKLKYPTRYTVVTDQINDNTSLGSDVLTALSVNTLQGSVIDDNGDVVSDFNGSVSVNIYDKEQIITTLNNDKEEIDTLFKYKDRPNMLFSGKAVVNNGRFSITFMIPKDIKYNYGGGRINYYAQDDENDYEAQGYFENFKIGGESGVLINDNEGPIIEQIYLNHLGFASKDKVNESPYFVATVSDENGINTVGSGIGHDMTLTVDNDPNQSYVLNSYFESELGSYKRGTARYKLTELAEGKHTLTYRVWDLLNNSTTVSFDFEVVMGLEPEIFSVISYPNPATVTDVVYFKITHDRPETILKATVDVFDLSGRLIWTFNQSTTETIPWNLTSNNGEKLSNGLYLYRISISTIEGRSVSKTNKIIIKNQ